MEMSTVSALAEARHTAYIRGRWVYTDNCSGELQYRVVDPSLPANGDYSPYNMWCKFIHFNEFLTIVYGSWLN